VLTGKALFGGLLALTVALFLLFPDIDLAASRLFYDPRAGFGLAWGPAVALERSIPWITGLIIALVAVGTLWLLSTGRPLWRLERRVLAFIALATALGPGLLVNVVLKDHWGRARPGQIEAFGGTRQFTPAPLPSDQCARNCAFVSGHAALGFSLVGFAFLVPRRRPRAFAIGVALGFGALVGLGRIAAGGHFLSDVVYAGFLIYMTSWLLHHWIVVSDGFAAFGARLSRFLGGRIYSRPAGRIALGLGALAVIEIVSVRWIDRPLALYLHDQAGLLRPFFDLIGRLGLGYPYLVLFGVLFAALRWAGAVPGLRPHASATRAASAVPAFLFAAVAASGLAVDLLKVAFGRTRPKLLFASGDYEFSWLGLQADYWSFPSGHAATVASLTVALWWLWPRQFWFYGVVAVLVAASRLVTGAHYLSDTVMGAAVAIVVTRALAAAFARGWFRLGRMSTVDPTPNPAPGPVLPQP